MKLLQNSISAYSARYRAHPAVRELKQLEIRKMLYETVVEPPYTECTASTVFAPKKVWIPLFLHLQ